MPRKLTDLQADDLVSRYLAGESTHQLGAAFGISHQSVSGYLSRAGITTRSRGASLKLARDRLDPEDLFNRLSTVRKQHWATLSPEEREARVAAAHDASRGVARSAETKRKISLTKASKALSDSRYEEQIAEWLRERSVPFTQQHSVGIYNLDFAVGDIDVEFTTRWARKKEWQPRLDDIFNAGWHLYVIWHRETRQQLLPAVVDDLIAWREFLHSSPTTGRQYRVVGRRGQLIAEGSADGDEVAAVFRADRSDWRRTGN